MKRKEEDGFGEGKWMDRWRWVGERDASIEVEVVQWRKIDGSMEVGWGRKRDGSMVWR